ncbi:hypothetical protein [Candidatus Villigracilis saccharophilus]|uniref:hypothetical protein n=1 Tax=Candidatus Villigracilis saccharophilus TaxID=3140684 RepID=UPI003136E037|nr:hypothetical protein [Anaerolineales bacterium]
MIVYFVGTIRALTKARSELGDLNAQLDAQVRERTSELIQRNSELEHEISERKKAEESLLKSEHRFRSLFERHHVIMLMIEPESGAILDANLAASNFYGYPLKN